MKNPLRAIRFACAVAGLASFAAVGPAESMDYGVNHYILRCGDYCPSAIKPVVFGGSIDATFTGSWYDPAQTVDPPTYTPAWPLQPPAVLFLFRSG